MSSVFDYQPCTTFVTTTIANGNTLSGAMDLGGTSLVGIQLPATLTGSAFTFYAATVLDGTYQPVIDTSGSALTATVTAGNYLMLNPSDFAGIRYLKIASNAAEAADRTLECVSRPV